MLSAENKQHISAKLIDRVKLAVIDVASCLQKFLKSCVPIKYSKAWFIA